MHWPFSSSNKRCCTKSPALQWPQNYLNIFSGIKYMLNNHYIVIFLMIVMTLATMTTTTLALTHDTMQISENNQQIENNNNNNNAALGDKNNNNNNNVATDNNNNVNNNNQINGAVANSNLGIESRSSYAMLSQAMSHAVSHELNGGGSGAYPVEGSCLSDGIDCFENVHDRLGMEAIKSLHQQLDDDDNGNIDLTESDDFLREELKYDSGYEKRHKTFHYNDDTQISVKELWEAWLRSEVHNWTIEQTSDWLAQSVQLPQYVELFQKHKVSGETLPRLAVNNMHYISNVLGVRDPIHKQKIALKAMDVVLFGPPRETGTRWKDYILITLLLSAIIGCWYAYQQNKNAKIHLRRMVKDMEGLQKAENALTAMQKELERARLEQENVATEKLDLERRLKEAPSLSSSSSDLEVQQLKQEIEMLRNELSRAEVELVDHCWQPPVILQSWLQYTYELESKQTLKKRVNAEKQLQLARDACEKLKRKRSSLVGAFVSTHGKSIDDVDRSIVEARNSLGEVTNELQERLHRWKQIESLIGCSIVHNNGVQYLENVLYNNNNNNNSNNSNINIRNNGKMSRGRTLGSQDELDDESVQGYFDNHGRFHRDDSSCSDDCGISGGGDNNSVSFIVGSEIPLLRASSMGTSSTPTTPNSTLLIATALPPTNSGNVPTHIANLPFGTQLNLQQQQQPQPQQHYHNTSTNHQPNVLLLADSSTTTSTNVQQQQQQLNIQNHLMRSINSNQLLNHNNNNNVNSSSNESNVIGNVSSSHAAIVDDNSQITLLNAKPSSERIYSLKHNNINTNSNFNNNLNNKKTLVIMNTTTSSSSAVGGNNGNYSTGGSLVYGNSNNNRMPHPRRTNSNQSVTITRTQSTEVEPMESYNTSHLATPSTTSKAFSSSTAAAAAAGGAAPAIGPHSDIQQLDDACSTDSSSFDGEFKKRRRKLHFPFGKKSNKNKIV